MSGCSPDLEFENITTNRVGSGCLVCVVQVYVVWSGCRLGGCGLGVRVCGSGVLVRREYGWCTVLGSMWFRALKNTGTDWHRSGGRGGGEGVGTTSLFREVPFFSPLCYRKTCGWFCFSPPPLVGDAPFPSSSFGVVRFFSHPRFGRSCFGWCCSPILLWWGAFASWVVLPSPSSSFQLG